MKNNIKVIIPDHSISNHTGDTFREMIRLWDRDNLCEVEYSKETTHVWLNEIGDILLYDRPTLRWLNTPFNKALFGNPIPNIPNTHPWIFWGRRPSLMEKVRNNSSLLPYNDRLIESVFLGKVENDVQLNNRPSNWSEYIELFEMPIKGEYKYSQKEYLEMLNKSKFGLCLAGFGNKCNREIELMCMGVVPIITPNVDLTYYNMLEENKHYLRVDKPSDIPNLIKSITEEKWTEMSANCLEWYENNCSVKGSFETTMKIVENINI